ncbi:MAG: acyl-CoA dehydrogenase family protein, partial [Bacteroidota bacterium]
MSQNPQTNLSFSPGIRMMIPMLYAAWSDRVLTPSEVRQLREKAAQLTFLNDEDKEQLLVWSNPSKPPARDLFKFWEITCQEAARQLTDTHGLVALGIALAGESPSVDQWPAKRDHSLLVELEKDLGTINQATYRNLFLPEEGTVKAEEIQRASFDIQELAQILDGDYAETKARTLTILQDPTFQLRHMPTKEEHREQVLEWCHLLAEQGMGALSYPEPYGGHNDMSLYTAVFETLGYHDLSLCIKFGVQFGLWGGSVFALGTKQHHDKYLADTGSLKLPGCFAMTETGHGSNVRGLETTATYDPETDEFIVHSPREEAGKEYIGNALHSKVASVFAQLI